MQDRYAGDVGDYVKLGLLRALLPNRRLGVAWYRYPDENQSGDGQKLDYLDQEDDYQNLDPELFNHLREIVKENKRSIASLQPMLGENAVFSDECVDAGKVNAPERSDWRRAWFDRVMHALSGCDLVFADPDNGIVDDVDDGDDRRKQRAFGKRMPLAEVQALARGRCAVIYHHNTRHPGGHDAEVDRLLGILRESGMPSLAVRAKAWSPRTFFVINPDADSEEIVRNFCRRWKDLRVRLHNPSQ